MVPLSEASFPLPSRRPRRGRGRARAAWITASAALVLLATGSWVRIPPLAWPGVTEPPRRPATAAQMPPEVPEIALATELMPLSPEEAKRLNDLRAPEMIEVVAAKPFAIKAQFRSDPHFLAALDCLTQAVYYEAGFEPNAGQRAVAQVVLNRVRHPAFPNSVCGVVYQGSDLPTGCQFTFTCDGSLLRAPPRWAWDRARRVALAALSGWVEAPVGLSTHYHATYVVPYWASALSKVTLVGQHIFYAFRDRGGSAGAFRANYDFAGEFTPSPALLAIQPVDSPGEATADIIPLSALKEDRVAGAAIEAEGSLTADEPALAPAEKPLLQADRQAGALTVGGAEYRLKVD